MDERWTRVTAGVIAVAIAAGAMMMMQGGTPLSHADETVTPEPTPVGWALSVDCDPVAGGTQTACALDIGPGPASAGIVLRNVDGAARRLRSFQVYVEADEAVLTPDAPACSEPQVDCNPDLDGALPGSAWSCTVEPAFDPGDPAGAVWSLLACDNFDFGNNTDPGDGPLVGAGESVVLGTVRYQRSSGTTALTPRFVTVSDTELTEIMHCNLPSQTDTGACEAATLTLAAPTETPTPTATVTDTPSATATATATATNTPAPETDTDGDGYTDLDELALGENPDSYCSIMRADVNGDGEVNTGDLLLTSFGFEAYVARYDQNLPPDGEINTGDLLIISFDFGGVVEECAP